LVNSVLCKLRFQFSGGILVIFGGMCFQFFVSNVDDDI